MRVKGINYDTGFCPGGQTTRRTFDAEVVRRDMQAIVEDMHCTAVRISGSEPDRLSAAGDLAAAAGLAVWLAPVPSNLSPEEMVPLFADCAARAEKLRRRSTRDVVLVLGCEVSVFAAGFVPGADVYERLANLAAPTPEMYATYPALLERLNGFLATSVGTARRSFGGQVTYASGLWEQVDWRSFDIVGVDAYRDASNASEFGNLLLGYSNHGKPVAITEFGCCTYAGAADAGGHGWAISSEQKVATDEAEQVGYLHDLLPAFEQAGVDAAFWFTFASYHLPPERDAASYGVVSLLDTTGKTWKPKEVFHALAAAYST